MRPLLEADEAHLRPGRIVQLPGEHVPELADRLPETRWGWRLCGPRASGHRDPSEKHGQDQGGHRATDHTGKDACASGRVTGNRPQPADRGSSAKISVNSAHRPSSSKRSRKTLWYVARSVALDASVQ